MTHAGHVGSPSRCTCGSKVAVAGTASARQGADQERCGGTAAREREGVCGAAVGTDWVQQAGGCSSINAAHIHLAWRLQAEARKARLPHVQAGRLDRSLVAAASPRGVGTLCTVQYELVRVF